jgi:hypothetical protein
MRIATCGLVGRLAFTAFDNGDTSTGFIVQLEHKHGG